MDWPLIQQIIPFGYQAWGFDYFASHDQNPGDNFPPLSGWFKLDWSEKLLLFK